MYDFHSHILPGIDDGSSSVGQSVEMLRMSAAEGVTHLAATPHFYANRMDIEDFLTHRRRAWESIEPLLEDGMPDIKLGAEVFYYDGISHTEELSKLCIGDTELLLLEMPFTEWSSRTLTELKRLINKPGIQVVIAHFERYTEYQPDSIWRELVFEGALIQSNAGFFSDRHTRRKALKYYKNGIVHMLGSDCHNTDTRRPNMAEASEIIGKAFGKDALIHLNCKSGELFCKQDASL